MVGIFYWQIVEIGERSERADSILFSLYHFFNIGLVEHKFYLCSQIFRGHLG